MNPIKGFAKLPEFDQQILLQSVPDPIKESVAVAVKQIEELFYNSPSPLTSQRCKVEESYARKGTAYLIEIISRINNPEVVESAVQWLGRQQSIEVREELLNYELLATLKALPENNRVKLAAFAADEEVSLPLLAMYFSQKNVAPVSDTMLAVEELRKKLPAHLIELLLIESDPTLVLPVKNHLYKLCEIYRSRVAVTLAPLLLFYQELQFDHAKIDQIIDGAPRKWNEDEDRLVIYFQLRLVLDHRNAIEFCTALFKESCDNLDLKKISSKILNILKMPHLSIDLLQSLLRMRELADSNPENLICVKKLLPKIAARFPGSIDSIAQGLKWHAQSASLKPAESLLSQIPAKFDGTQAKLYLLLQLALPEESQEARKSLIEGLRMIVEMPEQKKCELMTEMKMNEEARIESREVVGAMIAFLDRKDLTLKLKQEIASFILKSEEMRVLDMDESLTKKVRQICAARSTT